MELEAGKRGLKSHARGNIESPKPALLGDTGGVLPTSGGRKALSTCTKCALDGEISLRPTTSFRLCIGRDKNASRSCLSYSYEKDVNIATPGGV